MCAADSRRGMAVAIPVQDGSDAFAELQIVNETWMLVLLKRSSLTRQPLPVPLRPRPLGQKFQTHRPQTQTFALAGVFAVHAAERAVEQLGHSTSDVGLNEISLFDE